MSDKKTDDRYADIIVEVISKNKTEAATKRICLERDVREQDGRER
jgi:hypothetical protein